MPYVQSDGARLYYEAAGSGGDGKDPSTVS